MTRPDGRARHALARKRSVFTDSLTVVKATARALVHQRFLLRVIVGVGLVAWLGLLVVRLAGHHSTADRSWLVRPSVVALRLLLAMCLQFIVASWLFDRWTGERGERVLRLWQRLLPRLPAFLCWAVVLGSLDHATNSLGPVKLLRSLAAFALGYALSYAVPAAAVYRCGMWAAMRSAYRGWRRTMRSDLFAWSGMWAVNAAAALLTAVPEMLDLYTPGTGPARVIAWLVMLPSSMAALALGAGFCTVIFHALVTDRAPEGMPVEAVETVSGLTLQR